MKRNNTVLAIIPARSGSKGVPGKNLKIVGGVSLLERAIRTALSTHCIDHVVVSTDSELIANDAKTFGAQAPFLRPDKLSNDTAKMVDVIEHAVLEFESSLNCEVTVIILLEPTVPFRTVEHIDKGVLRYYQGDCNSVVTVCPLERKPQNILTKTKFNVVERYVKEPNHIFSCRQDMKQLCRITGGAYIVGKEEFFKNKSLIVPPIGYVEMSHYESINIDEELDLLLAEVVAKKFNI